MANPERLTNVYNNMKESRKKKAPVEHPILTRITLAKAAGGGLSLSDLLILPQTMIEVAGLPRALPAGVGELFGYRLAQAAGVRVAPVELMTEQPTNFRDFVKEVPGGWAISRRVEHGIPVFFLSDQCETVKLNSDLNLRKFFLDLIDKRCPRNRSDYSDFSDSPDKSVLDAATWNSPERILGHCYRAFLGATFAHSSNCIVDLDARLWLIDFEKILYEPTTDDITSLHAVVNKSEVVMDACRQVSKIRQKDIRVALSDIPEPFWQEGGVFSEARSAAKYFESRLKVWKKCFGTTC